MTMRVIVDRTRCEAYGVCTSLAPDVFEIDDDETMHVRQEHPPESLRDEIEQAVVSCPKGALKIEED